MDAKTKKNERLGRDSLGEPRRVQEAQKPTSEPSRPRNPQKSAGNPRKSKKPRRTNENPGEPRRAQGSGDPWVAQENTEESMP